MKANDIIRSVLDLIDQIDGQNAEPVATVTIVDPQNDCGDDRALQQIVDLLSQSYQMYDNSPAEVVAGIDSVTRDAGGGWMAPKNPADIRADSVSMYPYHSHKPGV